MVVEPEYQTLWDKVPAGEVVWFWFLQVGSIVGLCLVGAVAYLILWFRDPVQGLKVGLGGFVSGLRELVLLATPSSVRRVGAVAILTIKEAIRRRILYVFVLFFAPFLFAGWYLPNAPEGQLVFLVAFVNSAMTWLLLPLAVIMVSMSLPNDLKQKTIQTVVTKPIRKSEILVGRILGSVALFTVLLAIMGTVSLLYLSNQASQEVIDRQWTARVPVYASSDDPERPALIFVKDGVPRTKGTNVGKEWGYRSHIEGATSDAAHWTFSFDPALFAGRDTASAELTFDIFKTTKGKPTVKGDDTSGVWCLMEFRSPESRQTVHTETFRVNQGRVTQLPNLPAEMMKEGRLEVVAQCLTVNQFLGMATHDLFFLADERSFEANFLKGLFGLWLKLVFLISVAVSASTVLNGFVTFLFTSAVYALGLFHNFLAAVISGEIEGGGPIESFLRIVTQNNQTVLLEPTWYNRLAVNLDKILLWILDLVARMLPNLTTLDTTQYVAEGFDIPASLLARNFLTVLGYVVPVAVAGFYLFKSREIAA